MPDVLQRLKAALASRYRIGHELGAGGMFIVYLGHDVKHDRKVAVKVLRPELAAAGNAQVLIGDQLYPVIAVVSSNHTIIEIGDERTVEVGDVATLVGPDRDEIKPISVARNTGLERDYWIMTKLNALLVRKVV